ncbi:MAG TPA: coproporphyrinogen III oxidase family protein [Coriobacteriia bacterium]|nr:coproporphyrinogen III oxidase family protein [Coriobacteriia bacterium]
MLAERLLSAVMRRAGDRSFRLEAYAAPRPPAPDADREYLLYAHVPFCVRLCPYCSFNRFPFERTRAVEYFARLRDEMRMVAAEGYQCTSLYVGGGTPTVIVDELCETIDLARSLFPIREVSSETNPDHLVPDVLDRIAGRVDRLSVGVQSFDDSLLKQMDRYDKYGSAAEIFERIQSVGDRFHSLNIDMIFNFPSQTEQMLLTDVEKVSASGANQTTFYPLMVSPAVASSLKRAIGSVSYRREHRFYRMLTDALSASFQPATAWTFSRLGGGMIDEYIVDYEEYVGIGSGAFSFLGGSLYANTFSLAEYARRVGSGDAPVVGRRMFSLGDRMRYRFLMELFGLELDKRAFERDFGISLGRGLPVEMAFMRANRAFATDDPERLTLSARGRYLLLAMMRQFFIGVNSVRDQARDALPEAERALLFGDGAACADAPSVRDSHT